MTNFIQAHGLMGVIAIGMIVLGLFNVVMTGIAQAFLVLHKQEPVWMQKVGAGGIYVYQWLASNAPIVTTAQAQKAADAAPAPNSTATSTPASSAPSSGA